MKAIDVLDIFSFGKSKVEDEEENDEIYDDSIDYEDSEQVVKSDEEKIGRMSEWENTFAFFFQKFIVYSTGISVGLLIINIVYLSLFGADIKSVISTAIAMLVLLLVNERTR